MPSAEITVEEGDILVFRELLDDIAREIGETTSNDRQRFTLNLRFIQTARIAAEDEAVATSGPFARILGSRKRPPASVEKPHIVLNDFIGIDTQAQLRDIRRWAPDADEAQIREWAIDAIYYQLEPTVTESDVERQISIIRKRYGYDSVSDDQLIAIGIDQLHYEWSANAKGY